EIETQERLAKTSHHAFQRWVTVLHRLTCGFLEGRFDECDVLLEQTLESESEIPLTETLRLSWQGLRNLVLEQQGRAREFLPTVCRLADAFPQIPLWRAAAAGDPGAAGGGGAPAKGRRVSRGQRLPRHPTRHDVDLRPVSPLRRGELLRRRGAGRDALRSSPSVCSSMRDCWRRRLPRIGRPVTRPAGDRARPL